MIRLTDAHYTAIGRVTVESCTLDRELGEYLSNMGAKLNPKTTIGTKMRDLASFLGAQGLSQTAIAEFTEALKRMRVLVARRNALAHGVWIPDPNPIVGSTASNGAVAVRASEVSEVADMLAVGRKLLLRLFQDHLPQVVRNKKAISSSSAKLLQQL